MVSATWNRLWDIHEEAKEKIMFFVKPNKTNKEKATQ